AAHRGDGSQKIRWGKVGRWIIAGSQGGAVTKRPLAQHPLVVILDEGYGGIEVESQVLAALGARVAEMACRGSAQTVRQSVTEAHAVLVRESPIDAAAIDAMPNCHAIVRYGVGVDNIDHAYAAARGIYVANVPDYGVEEVSDHALALLFAVARRIV